MDFPANNPQPIHELPFMNSTNVRSSQLSFDPSRALPAIAYRDPLWLKAERQHIWQGDWIFATTEDALPNRGDQIPVMIGEQPVLLLRNQRNELVALSNLCAHRGTLLVEQPVNNKRIQCPYHAWTYDDEGSLIGVPFAPSEGLDRSVHCLPSYRVESWHGLVFVSLDESVESLTRRFALIENHVCSRGIDELEHHSEMQSTETWECNWKVAIMNAMESYHLFKVHPETLEPFTPTKDAYYVEGSARATVTGGKYKGQEDYLLLSLPPGFVGVITRDSFVWQVVAPVDTESCVVRTGGAFASQRRASQLGQIGNWLAQTAAAVYPQSDFLREDKAICERVQRGFTGDFKPGSLLPIERVVSDFSHYLNWRLNDVEPPSAGN